MHRASPTSPRKLNGVVEELGEMESNRRSRMLTGTGEIGVLSMALEEGTVPISQYSNTEQFRTFVDRTRAAVKAARKSPCRQTANSPPQITCQPGSIRATN